MTPEAVSRSALENPIGIETPPDTQKSEHTIRRSALENPIGIETST